MFCLFMKWSRYVYVCEVEGICFSVCGMEGVRTVFSSELKEAFLVKWRWHACLVQWSSGPRILVW